ncbi:MAG TPA: hypothetical protein PLP19_10280 [bacterium]|nr:hypothetical protein [bacterium]HPN43866.1 hypothetical protein [bacterium]
MQKKNVLWLVGLLVILWFVACESPVSTGSKNDDSSHADYAIYNSINSISDPAWSPDGLEIAFIQQFPVTAIRNISSSGDTLGVIKLDKKIGSDYGSVSPDGHNIIYSYPYLDNRTKRYNCYLYSVADDSTFLYNDFVPNRSNLFKWSRDGQYIYYKTPGSHTYTINCMTPVGIQIFSVPLDSAYDCQNFSVAPDNQTIVWSYYSQYYQRYQLWLYTPGVGQQKLMESDSIAFLNPTWSPDGSKFAYISKNNKTYKYQLNIYFLSSHTINKIDVEIDLWIINTSMVWSDNAQTIYFTGQDYSNNGNKERIWAVSLSDNTISSICTVNNYRIFQIEADGTYYINYNYDEYGLDAISIIDKTIRHLVSNNRQVLYEPAWSPDGERIVFSQAGKLCTIPAAGGVPQPLAISGVDYQFNPDYSPDGSAIAFDDDNNIYIVPVNGGLAQVMTNNETDVSIFLAYTNPVWSPNGKQIACTFNVHYDFGVSGRIIIYNLINEGLQIDKLWWGDYCTDISWSKKLSGNISHLLYAENVVQTGYNEGSLLKVRDVENDKLYWLIGSEHSANKNLPTCYGACWAPNGQSIAWIQDESNNGNYYSLNVARFLIDLY